MRKGYANVGAGPVSNLCSCQGTSYADGCRDRIDRPSVGKFLVHDTDSSDERIIVWQDG